MHARGGATCTSVRDESLDAAQWFHDRNRSMLGDRRLVGAWCTCFNALQTKNRLQMRLVWVWCGLVQVWCTRFNALQAKLRLQMRLVRL